MAAKRTSFFGLPLTMDGSAAAVCALLREKNPTELITFVGPRSWALAKQNPEYRAALDQMTMVFPDAAGVATACRLLNKENCQRLVFDMTSLAKPFLQTASETKIPLALVGGSPRDEEDVIAKLKINYPELNIVEARHGYGDFAPKIEAVMAKKPKVVVVAMGAPRQEAFIAALRAAGYKGMAIACGDFFDQYLAPEDYTSYPAWIDQWKLIALYRMYREPKRAWQRYMFDYQYFAWLVARALLGKSIILSEELFEKGKAAASRISK